MNKSKSRNEEARVAGRLSVVATPIGNLADWAPLNVFLSPYLTAEFSATVRASTFSASLEMVREGQIDVRQTEAFAPIYIRDHKPVAVVSSEADHG